METIYRKVNGRFVAIGMNGLPDIHNGIWIVTRDNNSVSSKNICAYLSRLPEPIDVQKYASLEKLKEIFTSKILNMNDHIHITGCTISDFVEQLVNELYELGN